MNNARRDAEWLAANRPTATPQVFDIVNQPAHYIEGRKYEPIDVIEDWELTFHLGNALKYISRAGRKDPRKAREDLQKAVFYLNRQIDILLEDEDLLCADDADELLDQESIEADAMLDLIGIPSSVLPGPDHDDVITFEEWNDDDPWEHLADH